MACEGCDVVQVVGQSVTCRDGEYNGTLKKRNIVSVPCVLPTIGGVWLKVARYWGFRGSGYARRIVAWLSRGPCEDQDDRY